MININHCLYRFWAITIFFLGSTAFCFGNEGEPKTRLHFRYANVLSLVNDSVPPVKKISGIQTDSSSHESVIKEVPKSRKQLAPVAIPVAIKVQPVKIITPKIIKPVIKIK